MVNSELVGKDSASEACLRPREQMTEGFGLLLQSHSKGRAPWPLKSALLLFWLCIERPDLSPCALAIMPIPVLLHASLPARSRRALSLLFGCAEPLIVFMEETNGRAQAKTLLALAAAGRDGSGPA